MQGTMVESGSGAPDAALTRSLVVALSLCNFAGRLVFGTLSDCLPWRRGACVALALALMTAGHTLAAATFGAAEEGAGGSFSVSATLFPLVCAVGLAYGGLWALMPIIVR